MNLFVNEGGSFPQLKAFLEARASKFYLVQAEYKRPGTEDQTTDFMGIDIALGLSDDIPLLLCSVMPESYFIKDKELSTKFFALMARKRTGFINTISKHDDFYQKYLELAGSEKEEDLLAIELEKNRRESEVLGRLKHNIANLTGKEADYESRISKAIEGARQAGFSGSNEEILAKIMNFKYEHQDGKFAGKYFPGVFCDLEGTLFLGSEINVKLLDELKTLSLTKPITLWTAGDLEEYQKKLISKRIFWKLMSKYDFSGAEVEIAFDDISYEELQKNFGIKVQTFNPVTTYNQSMELKLKFLHSLLAPAEISRTLTDSQFAIILDKLVGPKTIREHIEEAQKQGKEEYNRTLTWIRDLLLS